MERVAVSSAHSPSNFNKFNFSKILVSPWPSTTRNRQNQMALPSLKVVSKSMNEWHSSNYHPSIWGPKFIKSLNTPYSYECHGNRLEELRQEARRLLESTEEPCAMLNLIDSMQRLGVAYHFDKEIKEALDVTELDVASDLYTTSLHFRLLRGHAFSVSSDVFEKFKGENGKFMDSLREDVEGLLSLYEASHLAVPGEDVLEEAKNFSGEHLKSLILGKFQGDDAIADLVEESLEVPLHWRMPRFEARNFIDIYSRDEKRDLDLLQFAKWDYNLVQSEYQRELKELAGWWSNLGFIEKLSSSPDRFIENYLWATGITSEPQYSNCRIGLTKFRCISTTIDDIYKVHRLEELELFTEAVKRWNLSAMDDLPDSMKLCYFAFHNFVNQMVFDVMQDHRLIILHYLVDEWANLCRSYLVEAKWFGRNNMPTLDEYLRTAWISVSGHAALVHAYMLGTCTITESSLDCFKHGHELIYWSSLIARHNHDLATSMGESKRGDVTLYMIEQGASEKEAGDYIKGLISYSWKKLNEESAKGSLPKSLVSMSLNMARSTLCNFQFGDHYIGTSINEGRMCLSSLMVRNSNVGAYMEPWAAYYSTPSPKMESGNSYFWACLKLFEILVRR